MEVDNSKLELMMMVNPDERNDTEQKEFFNEFKKSTVLVAFNDDGTPVRISSNENNSIIPLFTDTNEYEKFKILDNFHTAWIRTNLLLDFLVEIKVDEVVLNPSSKYAIGMDYTTFVYIFEDEKIAEIKQIIKKYGQTLPVDTRFYYREKTQEMKKLSVNGIFTAELPFTASFKDQVGDTKEFLNILLIPAGVKFLPINNEDMNNDTVFAPGIRFKLIEENGEILTWQCISHSQKYRNKLLIYIILIIAMIILIVIIANININVFNFIY